MGYPELHEKHPHITSDCKGQFVRHHTADKDWVKQATANSIQQAMAAVIQKTLLNNMNEFKIVESDKSKSIIDRLKEAVH